MQVIVHISVGLAEERSLPYGNDYLRVIIDDTLSEFEKNVSGDFGSHGTMSVQSGIPVG